MPGRIWAFLRVRKRFWLLPLVVLVTLMGLLAFLAQPDAVAPFVYDTF